MNPWNNIIPGLSNIANEFSQGFDKGQREAALNDMFHTGMNRLKDIMTPQQKDLNIPNPMTGQNINMGQVPTQPNPQQGLQLLYQSEQPMLQYGQDAQPYMSMMENTYQSMLPQKPDYMTVGNRVLQKTQSGLKEVYKGEDKLNPDTQREITYKDNGDGTFSALQYFRDAQGNLTPKEEPATETEFKTWEAEQRKKQTSLSNADMRIQFPRISGGHLKKKTEDKSLSGYDKDLVKDIKDYGKLKRANWNSLTPKQQTQYKELNDRITQSTNKNADDVANDVLSQTFKNDKEMADYVNESKGQKETRWDVTKNQSEYAPQSDNKTIQYFSNYMQQLDEAYNAEQNGQQEKGYYDNFKKAFLKDLENYKPYLAKQDYEYLYNEYK